MYKITNMTKSSKKFREHKTGLAYFLRPGEEIIIKFPLVVANPKIFRVLNLNQEKKMEESSSKSRKEKLNKMEDTNGITRHME